MIACLYPSRLGQQVHADFSREDSGIRLTIQEGGDDRSNVLGRREAFDALRQMFRELAQDATPAEVNEWLALAQMATDVALKTKARAA